MLNAVRPGCCGVPTRRAISFFVLRVILKISSSLRYLAAGAVTALVVSACGNSSSDANNGGTPAVDTVQLRTEFLIHMIDRVVVPGYAELVTQTGAMADKAGQFCAARNEAGFEAMQAQWLRTMDAWQSMRWLAQGPINFAYRFDRFEAWPRASAAAVQTRVDLLLAQAGSSDAPAMNRALIEIQPVQAQGLPALEYLLFEDRSAADFPDDAAGNRRCEMVEAIAQNLQAMAIAVHENWTDTEARDEIGRGVLGVRTQELNATFDTMINQTRQALITMRHEQIGGPLGITVPDQEPIPNRFALQSARSETSLDHPIEALMVIERIMGADGGNLAGLLTALGHPGVPVELARLIDEAESIAAMMNSDGISFEQAVTTTELLPRAVSMYYAVRAVDEYWQDTVMPAAGAQPTFNFNDGD